MELITFEDEFADRLAPITLARPAYAISCGGYRLADWLASLGMPVRGVVRPHLCPIQEADFPGISASGGDPARGAFLVNARLVPSASALRRLQSLQRSGQPGVVRCDGQIAAAWVPSLPGAPPLPWNPQQLREVLDASSLLPAMAPELPLLQYPHDAIRYHLETLGENLEHRLSLGGYREIRDGVFAARGARLGEYCSTDTASGPILLEERASAGPFCLLRGPAIIGHDARLMEHAAVKEGVSIGHTAKIGGEVEASVVEPYTNKQHHGFLGHSYLGSWVNLGAGTCTSDLKNTYGGVNMEYRGERVRTGMQFLGCIMGDYSKTAVNTGIFTGKTVGVCSMLYGFITANVPSFVNYARLFGQVAELPPEVMIATQERMFRRRHVALRPCDVQLIHAMYELTRQERRLAGESLAV